MQSLADLWQAIPSALHDPVALAVPFFLLLVGLEGLAAYLLEDERPEDQRRPPDGRARPLRGGSCWRWCCTPPCSSGWRRGTCRWTRGGRGPSRSSAWTSSSTGRTASPIACASSGPPTRHTTPAS